MLAKLSLMDLQRERRITRYLELLLAQSESRDKWWAMMKAEISQRSPEMVSAMEKARGLE